MLRRFVQRSGVLRLPAVGAVRCASQLPQGFDYLESKVTELDPAAPYEALTGMTVNVTRHEEILFTQEGIKAVTLPSAEGEMGVQPGHEWEIAKLVPGVITVEINEHTTKKYFAAGGFAHVNPAGSVDVNCNEAIPLEDLDADLATKELALASDALKNAKSEKGSGSGLTIHQDGPNERPFRCSEEYKQC